jgi:hypothetical protein
MFHPIKLSLVNHWSTEKLLEEVNKYSDQEIAASEIIGRTMLSKRYAEKILYIITKYHMRLQDLKLLMYSAILLYNEQKEAAKT